MMTDEVIEVVIDDNPISIVVDDFPIVVTIPDTPVIVDVFGGVGPRGPQGPAGSPGGARYTHTQAVAASQWNVSHNLGYKPHVTLYTSDVVFLGRFQHIDNNNLVVVLNQPMTGKAEVS